MTIVCPVMLRAADEIKKLVMPAYDFVVKGAHAFGASDFIL